MKGFIAVICILLVILALLFFYQSILFEISDEMLSDINKIEEYVKNGNWEMVDERMEQLKGKWDETSKKLGLTIDHQEIDLIMLSLFKADEYRHFRETPEFMAEIVNLEKLIDHIPNKEKLSIENIL